MTLSKKAKIIIISVAAAVVLAGLVVMTVILCTRSGRSDGDVRFSQSEYVLENGGKVTVEGGADRICALGALPGGVTISFGGVVTVDGSAEDGAQFAVCAVKGGKVVDTAVVTVRVPRGNATLVFDNLSEYLVSGERVSVTATPLRSVSYSLKADVDGVSVDAVRGTVFFAHSVTDGTEFTVCAVAGGVTVEKRFKASVGEHVTADRSVAIVEYGVGGAASFVLDFGGDEAAQSSGVLGVRLAGRTLEQSGYTYDAQTKRIKISNAALKGLTMGDNALELYTVRNTVTVTIKAAKYIRSAEDLAAINDSEAALMGYYIMVEDVDLGEYLNGLSEGWKPIGIYQDHGDNPDGTEEALAFRGTFDGNGHTVSGLWMNRSDDFAFNAGLFGYTTNNAEIKNVAVVGSKTIPIAVKSFSGVLVGANRGVIRNCSATATVMPSDGVNMIGGFVGRNEGSIFDCYAVTEITEAEATNVGAFAGENGKGEIVGCYAVGDLPFIGGESLKSENCAVYTSADELCDKADFSGWSGWTTEGGLPVIPSVAVDYEITSIRITNTQASVAVGETLTVNVEGEPSELFSYNALVFSVTEGDGVTVTRGGVVDTSGATVGRCTVTVQCGELTASYSFDIISE